MTVLEIALTYHAAGLAVIPIRPDGSKAPALPRGHPYLRRRPAKDDLRRWFAAGRNGIAVACGRVSNNLETLDFETVAIYATWCRLVEARAPGLVARLCHVRTPGHLGQRGMHVRYRCPGGKIPGPMALAFEPERQGVGPLGARAGPRTRLLIETRGEGSYAVAPGSPAGCHETGRRWEHVGGPGLAHLPDLTPSDRDVLLACARALDRPAPPRRAAPWQGRHAPEAAPLSADNFNRHGPDWAELLGPHGWVLVRVAGVVRYWRRQGKARGSWSATTGFCRSRQGIDLLHVFSSNAGPFRQGGSYSKFRAHALLNHRGDCRAAAQDLAGRGFGGPPPGEQQSGTRQDDLPDAGHAGPRLSLPAGRPSRAVVGQGRAPGLIDRCLRGVTGVRSVAYRGTAPRVPGQLRGGPWGAGAGRGVSRQLDA